MPDAHAAGASAAHHIHGLWLAGPTVAGGEDRLPHTDAQRALAVVEGQLSLRHGGSSPARPVQRPCPPAAPPPPGHFEGTLPVPQTTAAADCKKFNSGRFYWEQEGGEAQQIVSRTQPHVLADGAACDRCADWTSCRQRAQVVAIGQLYRGRAAVAACRTFAFVATCMRACRMVCMISRNQPRVESRGRYSIFRLFGYSPIPQSRGRLFAPCRSAGFRVHDFTTAESHSNSFPRPSHSRSHAHRRNV